MLSPNPYIKDHAKSSNSQPLNNNTIDNKKLNKKHIINLYKELS